MPELPLLPTLPNSLDLSGRILSFAVVEGGDKVLVYDGDEIGHDGAQGKRIIEAERPSFGCYGHERLC